MFVHEKIFNLHDVMLLVTAGLAILLAIPMLIRQQRREADLFLAAFILTQGLTALYFLFLYSSVLRPATLAATGPFQIIPVVFLFLIQGYLLNWYSRAMAGLPFQFDKDDARTILIFLGVPIFALSMQFLFTDKNPLDDGELMTLPTLVVSIIAGFRALQTLTKHDQEIRQHFSNIDNISLVWLRYSAFAFVGVWFVRLLGYLMGLAGQFYWAEYLSSAANVPAMILVAWMVILGLSHSIEVPHAAADNSDGDYKVNANLVEKLEDLMVRVKVYQDPDLDLEGLADSLGCSPRSLSSLINGHYQMNFYDFVNNYRVSEAKNRLLNKTESGVPIQRIFEDAGFSSKSTFYAFFKKSTGRTPAEFRRLGIAS